MNLDNLPFPSIFNILIYLTDIHIKSFLYLNTVLILQHITSELNKIKPEPLRSELNFLTCSNIGIMLCHDINRVITSHILLYILI